MSQDSSNPSPTHDTESDPSLSRCSVALLSEHPVTFWAPPQTAVGTGTTTDTVFGFDCPVPELALGLAPGKLVVVGRAKPHHEVPYLDPAYRSTTVLPDGHQSVLNGNDPKDICVSRAHFTLRGADGGAVVFTNGVPAIGGGVRPPTNGTWVIVPAERFLDPGEEVTIGCGEVVVICLPNGCRLQLKAQ
jgi:hypothetical protein